MIGSSFLKIRCNSCHSKVFPMKVRIPAKEVTIVRESDGSVYIIIERSEGDLSK